MALDLSAPALSCCLQNEARRADSLPFALMDHRPRSSRPPGSAAAGELQKTHRFARERVICENAGYPPGGRWYRAVDTSRYRCYQIAHSSIPYG